MVELSDSLSGMILKIGERLINDDLPATFSLWAQQKKRINSESLGESIIEITVWQGAGHYTTTTITITTTTTYTGIL